MSGLACSCVHLPVQNFGPVLTKVLKYLSFSYANFLSLNPLNLPNLVLYFSHYLISSKFEAADEIMAKMDFKTRNSSKKSYIVKDLS